MRGRGYRLFKQQDIFRHTEGKLYWYYEAERKIELLKAQEERTGANKSKLILLRHEYPESCAYQGAKASYGLGSERVQGAKSIYHNPIESAADAVQDLEEEISLLWERQLKLLSKIDKYEQDITKIAHCLSYLKPLDREICEYKYKYKMSLEEIARNVNLSRGAVRYRRYKIVSLISERLAGA
jgi:hypothetical protein